MNWIKHLLTYPARLRRSHGFGVHSPFAYHFITRVLREHEAAYYAYPEIAAYCPKARRAGFNEIFAGRDMAIPEAQMLFRILCFFNPHEIVEVGNGHETTGIIYLRAVPRAKAYLFQTSRTEASLSGKDPLIIMVNQVTEEEYDEVKEFIDRMLQSRETVVFMRHMHSLDTIRMLWQHIITTSTHGMGFFDSYTGIFVSRSGLPSQTFEILM